MLIGLYVAESITDLEWIEDQLDNFIYECKENPFLFYEWDKIELRYLNDYPKNLNKKYPVNDTCETIKISLILLHEDLIPQTDLFGYGDSNIRFWNPNSLAEMNFK